MDERRKMTAEEAEAVLTLVRGGWLRLELTLDDEKQREVHPDRIARLASI